MTALALTLVLVAVVGALVLAGVRYERLRRAADRARPLPGRLVDVCGVRLHVTDEGAAGPPVVVVAGMGDSSYSWTAVRREVAGLTRVITYDRPGLGASDPGPAPDPARTVAELDALLDAVGIAEPIVLVGHSLGGLVARLYAQRHRARVGALVLVDPTHEGLVDDVAFHRGMAAVAALVGVMGRLAPLGLPRFCGDVLGVLPMFPERTAYAAQIAPDAYRAWTAAFYRACADGAGATEARAVSAFLAEAARLQADPVTAAAFRDLPLFVLTNPGYGDAWHTLHAELARRSARGVHYTSDRPGHSIQMVRPDLVMEAIREAVAVVRAEKPAA